MSITDNLKECGVRIGNMCRDARPPRMSIPVREDDDDIFITTTCLQAVKEIERLRAEREPVEPEAIEAIYAAWHGAGIDMLGGNWKRFVGMLPKLYTTPQQTKVGPLSEEAFDMVQSEIKRLTAERDETWQDAAQLCHEMYMTQEYQTKVDYCPDEYAEGIAEGMIRCAKELAKKAKELTK